MYYQNKNLLYGKVLRKKIIQLIFYYPTLLINLFYRHFNHIMNLRDSIEIFKI